MATFTAPYIVWRAGRPRFTPGPRERALGFTGQDLKHPDGRWFAMGEAAAWAQARKAEIEAARAGGRRRKPPAKHARTIADLLEAFLASRKFRLTRAQGGYSPETVRDYRGKARAVLAEPGAPAERRSKARATPTALAQMPVAAVGKPEVRAFFERTERARGQAMARGAVMFLSAAWKWGSLTPEWRLGDNPCSKIGLPKAAARVVVWTVGEIRAFVAAADHPAIGEPELADAVLLALFSGQREGDVLAYSGAGVAAGRIRLVQSKRGAHVDMPQVPWLADRLRAMNARRLACGFTAPQLVVDQRSGRGFVSQSFRRRFAALRARVAAGAPALGLPPCASIADRRFQDLRDTLITWLKRAGATDAELVGVSGHSLASLNQVLPHYFAAGADEAEAAMAKLEAWMTNKEMTP